MYHHTFEVIRRDTGLRVFIPLEDVGSISEDFAGTIIESACSDDIESNEDYDVIKARYEKYLADNKLHDTLDFDRRWEISMAQHQKRMAADE